MLSYLLFLHVLFNPSPAPSVTQVEELITNRSFSLGYPMPVPESHLVAEAALEERGSVGLPLVLAVIEIESKYERRGKSKKACKGLMQLSNGTANTMRKRLGLNKKDIFDIQHNIKLGVAYLAALLEENGSIEAALTVYNKGWVKFVANGKRVSRYAWLVVRRAKLIEKLLKNDLTCGK